MLPLGKKGVTSATIDPGRNGFISFVLDAFKVVEEAADVVIFVEDFVEDFVTVAVAVAVVDDDEMIDLVIY
jgi:hypothetical protein